MPPPLPPARRGSFSGLRARFLPRSRLLALSQVRSQPPPGPSRRRLLYVNCSFCAYFEISFDLLDAFLQYPCRAVSVALAYASDSSHGHWHFYARCQLTKVAAARLRLISGRTTS